MFTCKICGRKFRKSQSLAGHVSGAHSQNQATASETDNQTTEPATEVEAEPAEAAAAVEEPGTAEEIRGYLKKGYSFNQLTGQLHFDSRSVRREIVKMVPPAADSEQPTALTTIPVVVKSTEAVTPEFILNRLADGSDEWRKMLEGMMLLRAAQKMNREDVEIMRMQAEAEAKLLEPILRVMKEAREEQDAAAARAKESSIEIARNAAQEAAAETAREVATYFEQKKPDRVETKKPFEDMMSRVMETSLKKLLDIMFPGAGTEAPPGFSVKKIKKGGE